MKENTISIVINAPLHMVFEYTTNPANTHEWIKTMQKEEVNEMPVRIGTEYRNTNDGQSWTTYVVTAFDLDKVFELQEKDGTYFVRYTYEPISENETKMTYHEWDNEKGLSAPFTLDVLESLKKCIEIETFKQKLTDEGFPIVYEWTDESGTVYDEHEHQGRVSFYVTRGQVTFSGGIERTVSKGERIDVPINVKHTAVVGPEGCDYVVGQDIEGDA